MPKILFGVHDWQTTDAPSDYFEAARRTMILERRRALVVILTSLRGEDSKELVRSIESLRKRHLVVVASLREPAIARLAEEPAEDFDGALAAAGALHYEASRAALAAELRSGAYGSSTCSRTNSPPSSRRRTSMRRPPGGSSLGKPLVHSGTASGA